MGKLSFNIDKKQKKLRITEADFMLGRKDFWN